MFQELAECVTCVTCVTCLEFQELVATRIQPLRCVIRPESCVSSPQAVVITLNSVTKLSPNSAARGVFLTNCGYLTDNDT